LKGCYQLTVIGVLFLVLYPTTSSELLFSRKGAKILRRKISQNLPLRIPLFLFSLRRKDNEIMTWINPQPFNPSTPQQLTTFYIVPAAL